MTIQKQLKVLREENRELRKRNYERLERALAKLRITIKESRLTLWGIVIASLAIMGFLTLVGAFIESSRR